MTTESQWIDWLRARAQPSSQVTLGIGDDAAVLAPADQSTVVTTDLLAEGTHFSLAEDGPQRVGRKALAVNLSDLAAMAAKPVAAFVSLLLPRQNSGTLACELLEGINSLAQQYSIAIAGGDTNTWDGELAISITALGELTSRGPLLRSGAQPGDAIVVTGSFGGSRLGKHLDFSPRVLEALELHTNWTLHAGLDCSDGLALDVSRIAAASQCGAVFDLAAVPVSADAKAWTAQDSQERTALEHALGDGEDFELILAMPADEAEKLLAAQPLDVPLTCIGQFIDEPGLWQQTDDGRTLLETSGFQHELSE